MTFISLHKILFEAEYLKKFRSRTLPEPVSKLIVLDLQKQNAGLNPFPVVKVNFIYSGV